VKNESDVDEIAMSARALLKDRRLYVIFTITMIAVMGVASITPVLPRMALELHLTKAQAALLVSGFTFPGIFLTPLAGIAADHWGRKTVLVPSLFLFAFAGFSLFFVHDFHWMFMLRILQGVGASALGALNSTLIGDFFKGRERSEAMGYNSSVLSLSTACYPLIGGALAGFAWYFPFLLPLLAIPVGLFVAFGVEEPSIQRAAGFKEYLSAISGNLFRKQVAGLFMIGILTFVILYGAVITYNPFLMHQKFGLSAPKIGLIISLSSLTMALFASQAGRLSHRFGKIPLVRVAFFLYVVVCIMLPHMDNVYWFIIPILIFGCAQGLNMPNFQTAIADLAPDNQRGAFMSLNGMVLRLGQTLGPLIIGLGDKIGGLSGAYYTAALAAVLGLVILFTVLRETSE